LDLVPIRNPTKFSWKVEKRAKEIQDLHVKIRERIEKSNDQAKYMQTSLERRLVFSLET